jgi:pimeloyl-ACP methyl ester carboxylesterase
MIPSNGQRSRLIIASLAAGLLLPAALCVPASWASGADSLPRRNGGGPGKDESYPGITVVYDSLRIAGGQRLRLIATHPGAPGRYPVIFVVGWLSCDSVEAPPGTKDGSLKMLQAIVQTPGFATVRLDKPGVGDSEGDCARTDFNTELAAYRQAFRYSNNYAFVDPRRVFLLGISNGGGFAPLVAEGAPVAGYVVDGGWVKTWFEHMLEIERRRLALAGHPDAEINTLMKSVEQLYSAYLLDHQAPHGIFARHPELKSLWQGSDDQQYGRPPLFYQQLQELNLLAAWSTVRAPVLALHGEYDWIMSRGDYELLVALLNKGNPGSAEFVELPGTGHTFEHYASLQAAFDGKQLPFDDSLARRVQDWFVSHRD